MERPQNCSLINWVINWDSCFIHFQWMTLETFPLSSYLILEYYIQQQWATKCLEYWKGPQNSNLVICVLIIRPLIYTFAVNDIKTLLMLFGKDCSTHTYTLRHIIQIYSGITHGRVLNGELYTQRLHRFNLSVFVYRVFHEDFFPFLRTNYRSIIGPEEWREIFMKQIN